jgi:hypothetical protein
MMCCAVDPSLLSASQQYSDFCKLSTLLCHEDSQKYITLTLLFHIAASARTGSPATALA